MEIKQSIVEKWSQSIRFCRFVIAHFIEDDGPYRASALAFTTLLAIVPLMAVGIALFSSFPVFNGISEPLQNFIFDNFVPATGKVVQSYLLQFATQVSKLSIGGTVFLFVTGLLLMVTIESAMNKIWRVNTGRQGVAALLLYWAILSLSPFFLSLSLAASSYLISIPFFRDHEAPSLLLSALPFFLSLTGFTLLYLIVPNRPVSWRHALWGGLFASILVESAKRGFTFYLSRYNEYELLYGAFAAIPIFFVWIYWVWFITLLGAEISYALSVHHQRRRGTLLGGFLHALLWLQHLWLKQKSGEGMSLNELIDTSRQPFEVDSEAMIDQLKQLNLIHSDEQGNYILSRDLHAISLYWLSQHLPYPLPQTGGIRDSESDIIMRWYPLFEKMEHNLQKTLNGSLVDLFDTETTPP
ncbi:YihY family inner membrane protein [Legionella sp. CNM-4043-24]|uniref:YihY family inner membrane protein n=1 Tax=Legionella sp. CNM-4043-24 TaxID=3421646 RepID=UPI00403AB565